MWLVEQQSNNWCKMQSTKLLQSLTKVECCWRWICKQKCLDLFFFFWR